tara:strand:+ start:595 stop:858 length:264 start_codon:yes stop_codon:yes gene_type:complete
LGQTVRDYEILVVDDSSTDNTQDLRAALKTQNNFQRDKSTEVKRRDVLRWAVKTIPKQNPGLFNYENRMRKLEEGPDPLAWLLTDVT